MYGMLVARPAGMRKVALLVVGILASVGCATVPEPSGAETPAEDGPAKDGTSTGKGAPSTGGESASAEEPASTEAPGPAPAPGAPERSSVVAWYTDGSTTGTSSLNNFGKLKVDANTITVPQLVTLIETNKYSNAPQPKDRAADFDEVFLSRAQNAAFMTKLGKAVEAVVKDGYARVIVYSNGPRCIAEAAPGGWLRIAKAGAMIGLESYTTTLTPDIMAAEKAHPFKDVADLEASQTANTELFGAWEARVRTYVTDTKAQLGNVEALFDHITLLQYENMKHDVEALETGGMTPAKAEHFAALWYAAMKSAAAKEGVRWGIWHPA